MNSPVCYSSANALYDEAKRQDPSITKAQVLDYLDNKSTYTLHKQRRVHYKRLRTIPAGFFTDFQVDLADFQKTAKFNNGFRYILVGVEVLSRRAYAIPVKSKTYQHIRPAFDEMWAQAPTEPWRVFSDKGMEFDSKDMKKYFQSMGILKLSAENKEIKASIAERMIQTIKKRLYKYFSEFQTLKWIDALPKITAAINNSICRTTGLKPNDINSENWSPLWSRLYGRSYTQIRKNPRSITKGDSVRIARERTVFNKGYLPTFSNLVYDVKEETKTNPKTFKLTDDKGRAMGGRYYKEELAKAAHEKNLKVKKVIRTRKVNGETEFLVAWEGEPAEANSWISETDLILK